MHKVLVRNKYAHEENFLSLGIQINWIPVTQSFSQLGIGISTGQLPHFVL